MLLIQQRLIHCCRYIDRHRDFPAVFFFRIPTRCAASQLGDVLDIIGGAYIRNKLLADRQCLRNCS